MADLVQSCNDSGASMADGRFVGSLGMIRRFDDDEDESWLTIRDDVRGAYRLIEARREPPHSFRSCLHEAIVADLRLEKKRDYLISSFSVAHHQAPIEWPGSDQPQWVVVEFFPIDLYGSRAEEKVSQLSDVRWWTLGEIARGVSDDGHEFCERQRTLIRRADILPPWVSSA